MLPTLRNIRRSAGRTAVAAAAYRAASRRSTLHTIPVPPQIVLGRAHHGDTTD